MGPSFAFASRPFLFCSLASEEAGQEDSPDSGWRLCLRLHGPLHPEGLSPDGHELPFLFEQVKISAFMPTNRPLSLNPSSSGSSHLIIMATPQETFSEPRPQIPRPDNIFATIPSPLLTDASCLPCRLMLCCCAAGHLRPTTRCAPWRRCACRACTGTSPRGCPCVVWTACCHPPPCRAKTRLAQPPGRRPPPPCWPGHSGARA